MKLPSARVTELVASGEAHPFAPAGRRFREWAAVAPAREEAWPVLLGDAFDYVSGD